MAVGDTFEGLAEDAKKLPWWAWVAGGAVVFIVGKQYLSNQSASTTPASTPDTAASTLTSGGGAPSSSGGVPDTSGGAGGGFIQQIGTIRPRNTSGSTAAYDQKNPSGIPFDTQPGAYETGGFVPYGAHVLITGTPIQGPNNLGNTTWYPISYNGQSGYISGYDLASTSGGQAGGADAGIQHPVAAIGG